MVALTAGAKVLLITSQNFSPSVWKHVDGTSDSVHSPMLRTVSGPSGLINVVTDNNVDYGGLHSNCSCLTKQKDGVWYEQSLKNSNSKPWHVHNLHSWTIIQHDGQFPLKLTVKEHFVDNILLCIKLSGQPQIFCIYKGTYQGTSSCSFPWKSFSSYMITTQDSP